MTDDFAQREVDFLLGIGGIQIHHGQRLGEQLQLAQLRTDFDAVFLAMGLGGSNTLDVPGENLPGVRDAIDFIERSEEHTSELQSLMRISYAVFCLKKKNNRRKVTS